MGFPIGYTEFFVPNILIHVLTLLGFIRNLNSVIFRLLGIGDLLDPEISPDSTRPELINRFQSVSTVLIRELLPVVKYEEIEDPPENCAVCLFEFFAGDEIRQLMNCQHVFHRSCLDRWMDHSRKTCPLCRTPFVGDDLQESFNERLWAASGIGDYYGESPVIVD